MSAIVPPLDFIPKLPSKAVTETIKKVDQQTDELMQTVSKTISDSVKLPLNVKCDDPRMKKLKQQLSQIQEQITQLQESIPKIQNTITTVKQIVNVSLAVKSAITAAQLANPVTAALFVAQQLMAIQDATIVNALDSLKQFEQVPTTISSKIQTLVPPILSALQRVQNTCGDNTDAISISSDLLGNADYNSLVDTDFYNDDNVNAGDLEDRSDLIQEILQQQRDLYKSLQEAPSMVYQGTGTPDSKIGKPGDYYVDTETQTVYGPKTSYTAWI
jgi:DNA-binding protein YbaB